MVSEVVQGLSPATEIKTLQDQVVVLRRRIGLRGSLKLEFL